MVVKVNNSGGGNCMYFAYSISLMYFLRARNVQYPGKQSLADQIFDELLIDDKDGITRELLHYVLQSKGPFSQEDIQLIIEPILGSATRALAAKQAKAEYQTLKRQTKLAQAVCYGLEYHFKKFLEAKKHPLHASLNNDFKNRQFTDADIFRVNKINNYFLELTQKKYWMRPLKPRKKLNR